MVEEMKDDRVAPTKKHSRSIVSGVLVAALGLLVLAIAATEYYMFADIAVPGDAVNGLLGMTAGTTAYVAGYTAAGLILFAIGVSKVCRARRST